MPITTLLELDAEVEGLLVLPDDEPPVVAAPVEAGLLLVVTVVPTLGDGVPEGELEAEVVLLTGAVPFIPAIKRNQHILTDIEGRSGTAYCL